LKLYKPSKGTCLERALIDLNAHQLKVVNHMKQNDSLLVVHGTGTGKTLTAIAVAECFLDENMNNRVVFVGPAGLVSNFIKEMSKYGVSPSNFERYDLFSFDRFFRLKRVKGSGDICNNRTLLIVDEAHNMNKLSNSYNRTNAVLDCALNARKRLLLTATPYVNNLSDFVQLINMLYGRRVFGTASQVRDNIALLTLSGRGEQALEELSRYLQGYVSYEMSINSHKPTVSSHYTIIPMSKDYYKKYINILNGESDYYAKPESFYNAHRRAVNTVGDEAYYSGKLNSVMNIVNEGKKTLIFSNWLEQGLVQIEKILQKDNLKYGVISGNVSRSNRDKILKEFNNIDSDVNILLISKAGSEGLDLKNVRNVIVVDPPWNQSSLDQIIGRAVRYKSHETLPLNERHVDVYYMVSVEPNAVKWEIDEGDFTDSGDRLLYNIIRRKNLTGDFIVDMLKKIKI